MVWKTVVSGAAAFLFLSTLSNLTAADWFVDGSIARSGDGTSWYKAFKSIQEGIDGAGDGDRVTVAQGDYYESIPFGGKRILLDPTVSASLPTASRTIIDGRSNGSVVIFDSGERRDSVLKGFTITNGAGYGGLGGGILCINGSSPTIANHIVKLNSTERGGGIYVGEKPSNGLKVSPSGHYFTYKGRTVMLVGDSGTQCVMQNLNIDYQQWIDDLAERGVNAVHVWALLAPRQKEDGSVIEGRYGYVYPGATPWRRRVTSPGATDQLRQWDLTLFDEGTDPSSHYWPRLRDLVAYAKEKDMCVGITLFFGWPKWDTAQRPDWSYHPFNGVNGGHLADNDAVQIIESPGQEMLREKWSDSWPAPKKTQWIWERYCEKMITDLAYYGNVFFVFMDEHSYSEGNCGDHFMNFFKRRGQIYVDRDARREGVDAVYVGTRTSTNRNREAVTELGKTPARPVMLLEGPPYELGSLGLRQSMWTFAIGGGHVLFHDDQGQGTPQTGVMGYDPHVRGGVKPLKTYEWLGIIARFFNTKVLNLDEMTPRNDLISAGTEVYCLADPGLEYAVYLRSGGTVSLKLGAATGKQLTVEWLNPDSGDYTPGGAIAGGKSATFTPPSLPENDWVLHVCAATGPLGGAGAEGRRNGNDIRPRRADNP